jgi:hypothetical protein
MESIAVGYDGPRHVNISSQSPRVPLGRVSAEGSTALPTQRAEASLCDSDNNRLSTPWREVILSVPSERSIEAREP